MKSLVGERFGRLTVVEQSDYRYYPNGRRDIVYKCRCDCGTVLDVLAVHLRSGHTQSCGCIRREIVKQTKTKHGKTGSRLHTIWKGIKQRCANPNNTDYPSYGGRGITMCDEWFNDFLSFESWALCSGYSEELSLDRIDVNGNYCPENCRWVTQKAQCNNTRRNILISHDGVTHTMKEWTEILNLNYGTVSNRIRRGWDYEKALTFNTH